jgi:hypothetical protein
VLFLFTYGKGMKSLSFQLVVSKFEMSIVKAAKKLEGADYSSIMVQIIWHPSMALSEDKKYKYFIN